MEAYGKGLPEPCSSVAVPGTLAVSHPFLTQVCAHVDVKELVLDVA